MISAFYQTISFEITKYRPTGPSGLWNMDEYKVDSEYKVYELGPEADDFINDKGNRVERRGDFEKEYYYPILCAKRSMISSLVEWIENMDEWELKINILRFIDYSHETMALALYAVAMA